MLGTQVVENAVRAVRHLRSLGCEDIEFSPEDAGRSDPKFLYRVLEAVIEAGATTLNIPDTTGAQHNAMWLSVHTSHHHIALGHVCAASFRVSV